MIQKMRRRGLVDEAGAGRLPCGGGVRCDEYY